MFYDVFRFIRGVWEAVVLPYVILSIANLATDGGEAVLHLVDTVVVLFSFLWGTSHRAFPLSRSAIEAQRAASAASAASAARGVASPVVSIRRGYRNASEDEANDADSEAEYPSERRTAPEAASTAARTSSGSSSEEPCMTAPLIQRRLLLGKKGEVEEWLPALRSRLLIPPHHPLCVSRSLHQLVSIVIGPIQQPTVATMPTRHPEPQWPPHFLRTGSSTSSAGGGSGGSSNSSGGGSGGSSVGDPSTDDYSSSNSSATPHSLRHRGAAGGSGSARYRQASSVVYQRVSSRLLDFSSSRVPPHLIASITAHHVLSYPATRQKVLVMDLDETLCYVSTSTANMAGPPTFSEVIPTASGAELFHVWERPYARLFLSTAAKLFNLVLFTSASKPYADTILQRIDPEHLLKLRFYRQDCRLVPRGLLKKMCAVAGMRGVSTGNLTRQGSGDRSTAGVSGSGPLGELSAASKRVSAGGSTTNTDEESTGPGGGPRVMRNDNGNWGDATTPDGKDVPSSGNENDGTPATANSTFSFSFSPGLSTPVKTGESAGKNNNTNTNTSSNNSSSSGVPGGDGAAAAEVDDFPVLDKTVLNEHAKVLVKDLRVLKVPPELLVMIDNSEECTLVNPENALIVSPFIPSLNKATSNEKVVAAHATRGPAAQRGVQADVAAAGSGSQSAAEDVASKGDTNVHRDGDGDCGESNTASRADNAATPTDETLLMNDDLAANEGPEEDEVLLALLPMLECLLVVPDVRSILRLGKLY